MKNSVLNFHASFPTSKVELLLSEVIAQNLENTKIEISGVEIDIQMDGKVSLRGDQNVFTYQLPLNIHVLRPSGLFTVEGQGKASMAFQSEFTFDKSLNLHSKSELIDYKWIEKPELKLGSMSMSVEALINMIIKHAESILIGKIDKAVKEKLSIKNLIERQFYSLVEENEFVKRMGLGADIILNELDFNCVKIDHQSLTVSGQLFGYSNLGNQKSNLVLPQVTFDNKCEKNPIFHGKISLSYTQLITLINDFTPDLEVGGKKLEFSLINIDYTDKLRINAVIHQPAKMDVELTGVPVYKDSELLSFEQLGFSLKPKSMIYKLFVPVIKGMVESRLEEYLPFDLKTFVNSMSSPPIKEVDDFKLQMGWDNLSIDNIEFNSEELIVDVSAKELSLSISS
jgi:hypothetical protein